MRESLNMQSMKTNIINSHENKRLSDVHTILLENTKFIPYKPKKESNVKVKKRICTETGNHKIHNDFQE